MEKKIIRIIGATAICALLSINVTSFQHLQIGVGMMLMLDSRILHLVGEDQL